MHGLLNILKPPGPTSHDIVARVRRVTHVKRVGHAGTLDPEASGVLLVCLGNATRAIEYAMEWPKSYRATATFGVETHSEDQTGTVLSETSASHITREMVEAVLPQFTGDIMQIPPMVSAVHHEGRRLYDLARSGEIVERDPRPVTVYSMRLLGFEPGEHPIATLEVDCSRGTYIRTLCADIGRELGVGGHMSSLVRTAVGRYHVDDAVTPDQIADAMESGRVGEITHPLDDIVADMPAAVVSDADVARVLNGVIIPADSVAVEVDGLPSEDIAVRVLTRSGRLIAVGLLRTAETGELMLRPHKVFAE